MHAIPTTSNSRNFDQVFDIIGHSGKYQILLYCIIASSSFMSGQNVGLPIFAEVELRHTCSIGTPVSDLDERCGVSVENQCKILRFEEHGMHDDGWEFREPGRPSGNSSTPEQDLDNGDHQRVHLNETDEHETYEHDFENDSYQNGVEEETCSHGFTYERGPFNTSTVSSRDRARVPPDTRLFHNVEIALDPAR